ncbi:MAG TPA: aminopeptidase N, partial [Rhizobiaceae bacterium]
VLAVYTTRVEADRREAPILLSNGNPLEAGDVEGTGRHFAVWHDPFPKPSYLFAVVGGALASIHDTFTTRSGRKVRLGVYCEPGKEDRCAWAMDSLKRAMRWDEQAFGREYDLDIFMIVAVSDFNMGAMENKGLNIFNDKYVLADDETATDVDFANIEAIVAHEYFHNWTGNRITCRDWFQLCLKEGLTVFRDHEFSADQRSRAVKRIAEVRTLRAHQFPEDQGPLAHPARPRRYREINNFYTATVYEKGSEIVRMIKTILGAATFREGMDLYFERHDGEAATVEEFLKVFEDVSGRDLSQFALWYNQAGTPNLTVSTAHDARKGEFTIEIEQSVPPTPSEARKRLMHIPLAFGLVGRDGKDIAHGPAEGATVENGVIHVKKRRHVVRFTGIAERPALSLNRGFSAPVTLSVEQRKEDQLFLARHDSDPFSRWQAYNTLLTEALISAFRNALGGKPPKFSGELVELAGAIAGDETLEHAFRALALALPSEADIAREIGKGIDPDVVFACRDALAAEIARSNEATFRKLYAALEFTGRFSPDAASAGRRALRNTLLDYLATLPGGGEMAARHFTEATNMTDRAASLAVLAHRHGESGQAKDALAAFEERYRAYPLVMDKWLMIQATAPGAATLDKVRALTEYPGFTMANPNRVRALIGTFASANQTAFNRMDGAGYAFFAGAVLEIERRNPQLAARLATALRSWRSLEPVRQGKAREALLLIASAENLSADLRDIVERTLA